MADKEYIEREAAVAFLENMAASRYLIQCFESKEKFPTADVVEVVRCKYCKYSTKETHMDYEIRLCSQGAHYCRVDDNHYCGYGKRKVDNK